MRAAYLLPVCIVCSSVGALPKGPPFPWVAKLQRDQSSECKLSTVWCIHQTQIANHVANMVSPLHRNDAISFHQYLAVLVWKPYRLKVATNLGFGIRVDQKISLQLLGHIHSPTLWPLVDYLLQSAGLLRETACANLRSHSIRLSMR